MVLSLNSRLECNKEEKKKKKFLYSPLRGLVESLGVSDLIDPAGYALS